MIYAYFNEETGQLEKLDNVDELIISEKQPAETVRLECSAYDFDANNAEELEKLLAKHGVTVYSVEHYTIYDEVDGDPSMPFYALVHEDHREKNAELFGQELTMDDLEEVDEELSYMMFNYDDLVDFKFSTSEVPVEFIAEFGDFIIKIHDGDETVMYGLQVGNTVVDRSMDDVSWADMKALLFP